MRILNNNELSLVSAALYGELWFVSAIVTIGYLCYQAWEYSSFQAPKATTTDPDAYYDGAMVYLTHGHCA